MKRAHRKLHLFFWLLLGPAIAAILYLSITQRVGEPANEALPDALLERDA